MCMWRRPSFRLWYFVCYQIYTTKRTFLKSNRNVTWSSGSDNSDDKTVQHFHCSFFAMAPNKWTEFPKFDYRDSGKSLTFKAQVEGYEVKEVSTMLNIECTCEWLLTTFIPLCGYIFYHTSQRPITNHSTIKHAASIFNETLFCTLVPPKETRCAEGPFHGPVGTNNFTLLCYTRSNPEATVTWKANNADLRQGIIVQNSVGFF